MPTKKKREKGKKKTTKKIPGSQSAMKMQQQMPAFGRERLLLIYLSGARCFQEAAVALRRAPPGGNQQWKVTNRREILAP